MKKAQLEQGIIKIEIHNAGGYFSSNSIVGSYELDLTTVYFSYQHELYKVWLMLIDPTD